MIKVFHIRKSRISETPKCYGIKKRSIQLKDSFYIPKSQVIGIKSYTRKGNNNKTSEVWMKVIVTDWIWNKSNLLKKLDFLIKHEEAIIEGDKQFGINWDYLIKRNRVKLVCFYCQTRLNSKNKTRDHVIPRAILSAYGHKSIPNNIVPCCQRCNKSKANLHPDMFRRKIKLKIHETGDPKFRIILHTLDNLIETI